MTCAPGNVQILDFNADIRKQCDGELLNPASNLSFSKVVVVDRFKEQYKLNISKIGFKSFKKIELFNFPIIVIAPVSLFVCLLGF